LGWHGGYGDAQVDLPASGNHRIDV
jgi:hypothetical protein